MSVLIPSTALSDLKKDLPILETYVNQELQAINPTIKVHDCVVLPTAFEARVKIEVTPAPRETIWGEVETSNGTGTNSGNHYFAKKESFFFLPSDTIKEFVVTLRGNNTVGNTINIRIGSTIYGASITDQTATISFADPLPNVQEGGYELTYETDFLTDFKVTDSGFDENNLPVWRSRFHFGRDQAGNKELGLYSDSTVFPSVSDPFPVVNGKRAVVGQKFDTPITYNNKVFNYGAALLSSQRFLTVRAGNRIEVNAALPVNGKYGMWPAIWLLPTSLGWPPEIDMMERPVFAGENSYWFYTTEHWPVTGGTAKKGFRIDTRALAATTDTSDFHTYGLNLDADRLTFDYDGKIYAVLENRAPTTTWYMLLNMAVGGSWLGMPYGGNKLPADTAFPGHMLLNWMKIYTLI